MYLVYKNQEQCGPFSLEEIQEQIAAGVTGLEDLYWQEEAQEWEPLRLLIQLELSSENAINPPALENLEPTELKSDLPYAAFIQEKQPAKTVAKIYDRVCSLLTFDESIRYIAVQKKPLLNFSPEIVALTSERIFLFYKHLFRLRCDEYHLKEILNLELKKSLLGSHFTFKSVDGSSYGILYLPKAQGEKLNEIACAAQEKIRTSKQIKLPTTTVPQTLPNHALSRNPALSPTQSTLTSETDTLHRLEALKKMMEGQLITTEEYEAKKKDLLSRL